LMTRTTPKTRPPIRTTTPTSRVARPVTRSRTTTTAPATACSALTACTPSPAASRAPARATEGLGRSASAAHDALHAVRRSRYLDTLALRNAWAAGLCN
jgi:hypothetical protein